MTTSTWRHLAGTLLGLGCLVVSGCDDTTGRALEDISMHPLPLCSTVPNPTVNRELDLLFVSDKSGSMLHEQAVVAARISSLLARVEAVAGNLPSLHLGIISSDLGAGPHSLIGCSPGGDRGVMNDRPGVAGCTPPRGQFLRDEPGALPGERVRNFDGALTEAFGCVAQLGFDGCGFEQPLQAMRLALGGGVAENAGFLRPNAVLAVVFLTDEDDCSPRDAATLFDPMESPLLGPLTSYRCFDRGVRCASVGPTIDLMDTRLHQGCVSREDSAEVEPIATYIQFLLDLKGGDRSKLVITGIVGDPGPVQTYKDQRGYSTLGQSCRHENGAAAPAVRLAQLIASFGDVGNLASICQDDRDPTMQSLGDTIANSIRGCIPDPR